MSKLNFKLKSIGIQLVEFEELDRAPDWIDIEEVILEALYTCKTDRKLFGLICSWGSVYGDQLIAEKLIKLYKQRAKEQGADIWVEMFFMFLTFKGDRRFKGQIKKRRKSIYPRDYYQDAIKLKGADPIYSKYKVNVPNGFVKITKKNIMPPNILTSQNRIMRNRYIIGPNWRADIISAIEAGIENPYRISKTIGCSYDPAYRVFQEYHVVANAL